ncbi:unnamed protein product, partial [Porites evermanni]
MTVSAHRGIHLQWWEKANPPEAEFHGTIAKLRREIKFRRCFTSSMKEPGEDRFTDHVHRSIFTASTPVQDQTTNSSSSGPSSKAVTVTELPAHENVKNDVPEKATGENKLLFLLFLLFAFPIIGIAVFCCKRRKSRKPEEKDARKVEQTCPLMSRRSRGLDTLVRDVVVEDRRKITSWLNEKTSD